MPQPTKHEFLEAHELLALREALANPSFVSGLQKTQAYEAKIYTESMENEALNPEPNTHRLVQYAARSRSAKEFISNLKNRIETLTVRQNG